MSKATKIKVRPIADPNTKVTINSGIEVINRIKREFSAFRDENDSCKVEVFDMWNEIPRRE